MGNHQTNQNSASQKNDIYKPLMNRIKTWGTRIQLTQEVMTVKTLKNLVV